MKIPSPVVKLNKQFYQGCRKYYRNSEKTNVLKISDKLQEIDFFGYQENYYYCNENFNYKDKFFMVSFGHWLWWVLGERAGG